MTIFLPPLFFMLLVFSGLGTIAHANPAQFLSDTQQFEHLQVSLLSESRQVLTRAQGGTGQIELAFKLEHEPHWHTYWKAPGDSGLASKARWTLNVSSPSSSENSLLGSGSSSSGLANQTLFQVGELRWPVPKALEVGGIHNIGYEGETWLLAKLQLPSDTELQPLSGQILSIAAELSWLVCKEECIPGKGKFQLKLLIAEAKLPTEPLSNAGFAAARAALPRQVTPPDWQASYTQTAAQQLEFSVQAPDSVALQAFESGGELFIALDGFTAVAPTPVKRSGNRLQALRDRHEAFTSMPKEVELLWVARGTAESTAISILASASRATSAPGMMNQNSAQSASSALHSVKAQGLAVPAASQLGFWTALLFAFLGGLILNVMPCVLPVLSLKALSFLDQSPSAVRAQALSFSAGVLISFLALASLLLAIRAGGEKIGWGFQLQSSGVVIGLSLLMFALGLSMSGLVHFGQSFAAHSSGLTEQDERSLRGSFLSGVLACVVASPCTAPAMGTALGYAFTQPAAVSLAVITALALGFAAPMLAIAAFPHQTRWLPKPGAWMQTLKHVLAVPLYFSAIWLLWILGQQRGVDAIAWALIAMVLLGIALCWWEQLRYQESKTSGLSRTAAVLLGCASLLPVWLAASAPLQSSAGPVAGPIAGSNASSNEVAWLRYDATQFAALRTEAQRAGKPILVEMTAAWCITCKVNEKFAMSGPSFAESVRSNRALLVKGDWTNQDESITRFLESFAASGVPLVVVYDVRGGHAVLPQMLSPTIVSSALQRASVLRP